MYQHVHQFKIEDGQHNYTKKVVKQADTQIRNVKELADNQTDTEADIAFPVANLQSVFLEVIGGAVEIQTNDGTEWDDRIQIPADGFVSWVKGVDSDEVCPFKTDVSRVFLTNTAATKLRFLILYNATS